MICLDQLSTGIITRVEATADLSAIHGEKIAFGQIKDGVARPKCRYTVVGDNNIGTFGTKVFDSVRIQFSVFADTLTVADNLRKAILSAFHGNSITLSDGSVVMPQQREGTRVLVEDQQPAGFVYHGICVVEFRVLT